LETIVMAISVARDVGQNDADDAEVENHQLGAEHHTERQPMELVGGCRPNRWDCHHRWFSRVSTTTR